MHAYATEATTILDRGGIATIDEVSAAVAATLRELWGLPPGPAQTAARGAVRFLDETGVFVLSEPDGTVSARLSLFAEIGDAIHAIQHPDAVQAWVARRITGRQLEAIVLAAALDERVNQAWQRELSSRPHDLELARAMVRAHREGTRFADDTLEHLRAQLIASINRGNRDGWSDWSRLAYLGVPDGLVDQAIDAAAQHSPSHELLARATISLQREAADPDSGDEALLLELLTLRNLPRSAQEPSVRPGMYSIAIDSTLTDTQLAAATVLLGRAAQGAVEAIRARALKSSRGLSSSLLELLRAHGHADVAAEVVQAKSEALGFDKFANWLDNSRQAERYPHFLRLVADAEPGELTTRQRVQLGELGDFLETLDMNDMGVASLYRQSDDFLRQLIDLACVLFGFDRRVLAAEAETVLGRLETDDSLETYFSLFDTAEARSETDWSSVDDPDAAVDLLVELFFMSWAQAWLATRCLWGSGVAAPRAGPVLRNLLPRFDPYPRHQQAVANALASLPVSPEPRIWSDDPNPVLRAIAARRSEAVRSGRITKQLEAFLADEDGYVREAALENLATTDLPELESVLEEWSSQELAGWKCLDCCTVNPPGAKACQKDDCHFGGPDPAAKAKELLDQLRTGVLER